MKKNYALAETLASFEKLVEPMVSCLIEQVGGDTNDRIVNVKNTKVFPASTQAEDLVEWRDNFTDSAIIYISSKSVYLAIRFKNKFALHVVKDSSDAKLKGVVKYGDTICLVTPITIGEIVFTDIKDIKGTISKVKHFEGNANNIVIKDPWDSLGNFLAYKLYKVCSL